MNRDWEIVNVFLTHSAPDDMYQAWLRIRAEQGESTNSTHNSDMLKVPTIEECYQAIPFPSDERECAMFVAGIAECHKFIVGRQLQQ